MTTQVVWLAMETLQTHDML